MLPNEASQAAEDVCNKSSHDKRNFSARGSSISKRVVAPQQQEENTRVTRQRTAVAHDALVSTTTSQNEEQINVNDEGK